MDNILNLNKEQLQFISSYLKEMKKFSKETFNHIIDVSQLSLMMAKNLGMSDEDARELYVGALLHDIGKLQIPSEILHKPKLTNEEFAIIKNHSQFGYDKLGSLFNDNIKNMVINHHEKPNGSGYPRGLKDEDLSKFDKIISVCDVTSALKLPRCYKEGMKPTKIISILNEDAEKGNLDKKYVDVMVNTYLKRLSEQENLEQGQSLSLNR